MELAEVKTGKLIRPPRSHSTKEMFSHFNSKNPKNKIPYWMFKEVIARVNKKAADAVIFGEVFNFGNRLGNLLIKKITRNYKNPKVDWGASKRLKASIIADGNVPRVAGTETDEAWLVYFSDPWYLRWTWQKKNTCNIKNQSVYKFVPTSNRSKKGGDNSPSKLGNKGKLVLANQLNPTLHLKYYSRTRQFNS